MLVTSTLVEGWRKAAVQVEFHNQGDQDASAIIVTAALWRQGREIKPPGTQRLPGRLAKAGRSTFSFEVPKELRDFRRFEVKTVVRSAIAASHEWRLATV